MRVLSVILLLAFLAVAFSTQKITHCDVAVIGGGGSGANTAVFLKDKGYNVCVFEPTAQLGGACNTFYFEAPPGLPNWIDIGVQIYGNTTYYNENGLGTWNLNFPAHLQRFLPPGYLVSTDFTQNPLTEWTVDLNHNLGPFPAGLTPEEQAAVDAALVAYTEILFRYPWMEDAANLPDPIPPELLVPFSQFIEENNLQALASTIFVGLTFDGGLFSYDKLTTLYGLLNARRGVLALFEPTLSGIAVVGGCGAFYAGVTEYLGSSVYLNAKLQLATRPLFGEGESALLFNINGEEQLFTADSIIMAMPQTLQNLAPILPDLKEIETFAQVQVRHYYAMELTAAGPLADAGNFSITNIDVAQPGEFPQFPTVLDFERALPYGPMAGWFGSETPMSTAAALSAAKTQLAGMPAAALTGVTVEEFIYHPYQPYFPVSALSQSPTPYTNIKNIQGYRNTYYVGALMTADAESVKVCEQGYNLVNEFF